MQQTKLGGKFWTAMLIFGLMGQVCTSAIFVRTHAVSTGRTGTAYAAAAIRCASRGRLSICGRSPA